ncbi:hypothetical protein [Novosphingobium beihaiensis]|uniref:Tetratricopeptide repeat protein n=1 Tax=Novosphingobium beihaiensis TaxID=2930389 RepID=A0ABT0BW16_9SPHN|nr:hypothetical protein [Novosphingobium beihaiensis]MCJ2189202.1 hypothetical protein [Novosphingobium beihaiensis]
MSEFGLPRGVAFIRPIAILIGGLLLLWFSIGVTFNFTIADRHPELAQALWPVGVTARLADAEVTLATPSPTSAKLEQVYKALRNAALREPVSSYALGMLGAVTDYRQDKARARTLFKLSEQMSRRNLLTQMWLIQDAVGRDDVREAIHHYDRAMRVSVETREQLMPVLISAASAPGILKELLPVLAERPTWWRDFAREISKTGSDPRAMSAIIIGLKPNLLNIDERHAAEGFLRRIVALKARRIALRTVNRLEGKRGLYRTIQNGAFEEGLGLLPFAWLMHEQGEIQAYRGAVPNSGYGIWIETHNGVDGDAAKQLIGLGPGRHVFTGVVGSEPSVSAGQVSINISCGGGQALKSFSVPASSDMKKNFQFAFDVPKKNCWTQWITLHIASESDARRWLDDLLVR